jgi:DNA-binding response OmpR family regulator
MAATPHCDDCPGHAKGPSPGDVQLTEQSEQPRILVVDDQPEAAQAMCELVDAAGFACHVAGSDRAAYLAFSRPSGVLALIVDVNLGTGTTGYDVARYARQINPAMPIIYVSGEVDHTSFRAFGVPGSLFLHKPFRLADLEAALAEVMA